MKYVFKTSTYKILIIVVCGLLTLCGCDNQKDNIVQNDTVHILRVIGLFPMTGPGASLGTYLYNGVTLAKDDLENTYRGKIKIDFEVIDTKNQPKEAISGLRSAISKQRPDAVITALSSVSNAVKPILESEGIFTVATTTALNGLVQGTRNLVRVYPTADNFAEPIAQYAQKKFGSVSVFYIHDDFGESVYNSFERYLFGSDTKIFPGDTYELLQKDVRSLVSRTINKQSEAIYIIGYGPAYVNVIKQIREISPHTSILADISFPNPAVLKALGEAGDGVIFDGTDAELTQPKTEKARSFRTIYKNRFHQDPFMVAGFAYDSLTLITKSAITKNGVTTPSKRRAISISPLDGIMGKICLNNEGESNISLKLMTKKDGKIIPIEFIR